MPLTDVLPSDWAFQALQSLVENYGCIQGYPDRTFRGQRALTRFEFAAGLNACLDVIATLIAQSGIDPEDLAAIRRLQQEFQAELATLRGRVDALEAETATLRAQQFSTTTKLRGEAVFNLITPFDTLAPETSTSVASRARLNFDTSFSGRDRLRIRLQAGDGNAITGGPGNPLGGLATAAGGGFNVDVTTFAYSFPLGNRINATVSARGNAGRDWVNPATRPFDGPSVANAGRVQFYDTFGSTSNGAGVGLNIAFTDNLILDLGYTASNPGGATNPAVGIAAARNQSYIAQLNLVNAGILNLAAAYLHSDGAAAGFAVPTATDTFAGLVNLNFGGFFIAGHGAFTSFTGGDDFSWTAGLGINNFLVEGARFGVYGGQLPTASRPQCADSRVAARPGAGPHPDGDQPDWQLSHGGGSRRRRAGRSGHSLRLSAL
nr:carbohydrate porin [Leptolyngbya sp. KIOST-1]